MRRMLYAVAAALMLVLAGCRGARYIPETAYVYKTDTVYMSSVRTDSVYIENTDTFLMNGDTVREIKWRTRYVTRLLTDTVYKAKSDTVMLTRRVEVEKPLTGWQKVKIKVGGYTIFTVLLLLAAGGWYLTRRLKKP